MKKVKYDYSKLRGKIREVYKTESAFAHAMQLKTPALSRRLCNTAEWKRPEILCACDLLGIPLEEIHLYFFVVEL